MATPGRLSWSKRKEAKRREEAAAIVITDSEEEKENAELEDTFGGAAPSFRNHTRSRRRESTILAGNMSYQGSLASCTSSAQISFIHNPLSSKSRLEARAPLQLLPQLEELDVSGEGSESFQSCRSSPEVEKAQLMDSWMTEVTSKGQAPPSSPPPSTPSHALARGSSVKKSTFFSIEKRRRQSFASAARPKTSQVLCEGSDSDTSPPPLPPSHLKFGEQTLVAASPEELVTEDEGGSLISEDGQGGAPDSPTDDAPLVSLGRDYMSDSRFGRVGQWVVESPVPSRVLRRKEEDRLVEELLRSDPREGTPQNTARGRNNSSLQSGTMSSVGQDTTSQGTSKAGASYCTRGEGSSQGTSKAGGSWGGQTRTTQPSLDDTADEFDRMCLTPKPAHPPPAAKLAVSGRGRKADSSTQSSLKLRLSESPTQSQQSLGEATSAAQSPSEERTSKAGASYREPSPSPLPGDFTSPISMAGGDTILPQPSLPNISVRSALDTSSKSQLPIDNSVSGAALRSWAPNTTQLAAQVWGDLGTSTGGQVRSSGGLDPSSGSTAVSEAREKQEVARKSSSSSGDEALDTFLKTLKKNRKPVDGRSSGTDPDFVVPDGSSGSDSESLPSPKLSLRVKVLEKSGPAKKPEASSESDSLPDIDSPVVRKKLVKDVKKKKGLVIESSDSDSEVKPVRKEKAIVISDSDSGEEPFVNIYSPKYYSQVPPPDPSLVSKPPKAKTISKPKAVRGSKISPKSHTPTAPSYTPKGSDNFKTPARPSALSQEARGVADTPTLTFLSSLTQDTPLHRCHPEAKRYTTLKNFAKTRIELARRLHELYNREIFGAALPADMAIDWNVRLTKTAGLCYSRRERRLGVETRSARIELSTKVIDSADRLRDTLVHEMCHAASWVVSGYRDGHGPLWRRWAELAMARFPELPVIDRCHAYAIRTKYSYRCVNCGYTIGRHSKSLDTDRKVCGHCHGRFELVVNGKVASVKAANGATPAKAPKAPNPFAVFVKDNYGKHRAPGVNHGDVMKILSAKFSETKISK